MKAGDTFLKINEFGITHMYVVMSDPSVHDDIRYPSHVFLVMLSSYEHYKDSTCVLKQGEHPFIKHDSVIVYKTPPAIFEPQQSLQRLIDRKILIPHIPVPEAVLCKIRTGYVESRYRKDLIFQFLFRQGVIR